jgi:hypothetical protein
MSSVSGNLLLEYHTRKKFPDGMLIDPSTEKEIGDTGVELLNEEGASPAELVSAILTGLEDLREEFEVTLNFDDDLLEGVFEKLDW